MIYEYQIIAVEISGSNRIVIVICNANSFENALDKVRSEFLNISIKQITKIRQIERDTLDKITVTYYPKEYDVTKYQVSAGIKLSAPNRDSEEIIRPMYALL